MNSDIFLMIVLVPVFVFLVQKYIDVRASYYPPTQDEIKAIEERSRFFPYYVVNNIPMLRRVVLFISILDIYGFGMSAGYGWMWVFAVGIIPCILLMAFFVNWRVIFKP